MFGKGIEALADDDLIKRLDLNQVKK